MTRELQRNSVEVTVIEPHVDEMDRSTDPKVAWMSMEDAFPGGGQSSVRTFDAVVLTVAHAEFCDQQKHPIGLEA